MLSDHRGVREVLGGQGATLCQPGELAVLGKQDDEGIGAELDEFEAAVVVGAFEEGDVDLACDEEIDEGVVAVLLDEVDVEVRGRGPHLADELGEELDRHALEGAAA
ncbi:unannotated protein [freshwater metagenome]|uniref:Unannotated protein n=1 Tax=freshwater metagenome TaxID=449393 RepID=A0A6J7QQL4_9ZZZZ